MPAQHKRPANDAPEAGKKLLKAAAEQHLVNQQSGFASSSGEPPGELPVADTSLAPAAKTAFAASGRSAGGSEEANAGDEAAVMHASPRKKLPKVAAEQPLVSQQIGFASSSGEPSGANASAAAPAAKTAFAASGRSAGGSEEANAGDEAAAPPLAMQSTLGASGKPAVKAGAEGSSHGFQHSAGAMLPRRSSGAAGARVRVQPQPLLPQLRRVLQQLLWRIGIYIHASLLCVILHEAPPDHVSRRHRSAQSNEP